MRTYCVECFKMYDSPDGYNDFEGIHEKDRTFDNAEDAMDYMEDVCSENKGGRLYAFVVAVLGVDD